MTTLRNYSDNLPCCQDLQSIEAGRHVAMAKIRAAIQPLQNTPKLHGDSIIRVRMEDSEDSAVRDPFLISSPGRAVQILSSHTIHHFAVIATTMTAHGASVRMPQATVEAA